MKRRSLYAYVAAVCLAACGGDDQPGAGEGDPDAGVETPGPDAAPPAFPVAEREWAWMPVDGTRCMNNSSTGMGLNLDGAADQVLIYLEGGGACFNSFTCSGVAHPNGFGEADLEAVAREVGARGIFNREDPDNPFRDWNYVFIPYCSGDIFAGAAEQGVGGRVQVGYENIGAYLEELVPAFSRAEKVVLTGSSAGGFGALYNYDRTQQAFGDIPVHLLDDSGPPLPDDYLSPCLQQQIREAWNLEATLPSDCDICNTDDGGGLVNIIPFLAEKYPDRRLGIITSTRDGVIRLFYGWGYPNCQSPQVPMPEQPFADGVAAMVDELDRHRNWGAYVVDSGYHVWLFEDPLSSVLVGDVTLSSWVESFLSGDGWGVVGVE
jgi:hypothetical protein